MTDCIFCHPPETEIIAENKLARAFYDKFPINYGHVLIVPKRHIETLFDANKEELAAINQLLFKAKEVLAEKFNPDGYNIEVNVGWAGGQTIFHLRYRLIPRFKGDVADPRGGIRKIKKSVVPYAAEGE
ncbi:HIT family protein [Peptococcaceae bacterium 1198_IL3148]